MTALAPSRDIETRFKPKHDKAALRQAYALHLSEGRSNGEFAQLHNVGLRTLQLYISQWRNEDKPATQVIEQPQAHGIGEDREFSPISTQDKSKALRTWMKSVDGKPVTPTSLKAAEAILKASGFFDQGTADERSEFQAWTDSALTQLITELAPRCGIGEARIMPDIKHSIPAPLHIEASPAAVALAPSMLTSSPEGGQPEQGHSTSEAHEQHAQESPPQISSSFQEPTADEGLGQSAEHTSRRADETGAD